jgi:hypothetical protein
MMFIFCTILSFKLEQSLSPVIVYWLGLDHGLCRQQRWIALWLYAANSGGLNYDLCIQQ